MFLKLDGKSKKVFIRNTIKQHNNNPHRCSGRLSTTVAYGALHACRQKSPMTAKGLVINRNKSVLSGNLSVYIQLVRNNILTLPNKIRPPPASSEKLPI